jgi:hypothetical protein
MMTRAQLARFALSLPEAHAAPHFERTSYRVGTKIFATVSADGKEAMVRVSPRERVHDLLAAFPTVFFSYGGWTERNGSLGVRLAKVDAGLMRELVTESWKHVAPKRVVAAAARKK